MFPDQGFLDLGDQRLEYRMIGPRPDAAPTLVLLHEGLGCVAIWGDFPSGLRPRPAPACSPIRARATAARARSALPRPLDFMHDEAREVLPRVLDAIGFRRGILIGHSDGASIAAIYAGSVQDHRVRGLVLMAPHFFIEDVTIDCDRGRRARPMTHGDLRARLARYHADVDAAFRGWSDAWLDPGVPRLGHHRGACLYPRADAGRPGRGRPVRHAAAGRDRRRRNAIARSRWRCCRTRGHAPHREAPEATLDAVADFVDRLLRDHREGDLAARGMKHVVNYMHSTIASRRHRA